MKTYFLITAFYYLENAQLLCGNTRISLYFFSHISEINLEKNDTLK